jgi:hypothetical protein
MVVERNGSYYSLANFRNADVITDNNYSLILKLERKGMTITGSYSRDGAVFNRIGTIDINLDQAKAGLIVCSGSDEGKRIIPGFPTPEPPKSEFEAAFDYFRITNRGVK